MKKFIRIAGRIVLVLVLIIICIVGYIKVALPNVGDAPEIKVDQTAERVARGEYLANNVTVCIDCHSTRDWSKFSGPIVPGTFGKGGELFDQKFGFPGAFYARNITPEGISRYTDGELFRLITTGVTKENTPIFPVMPYHNYGRMDEEDIKSIIAYIRTLKPIKNDVPASVPDFPMSIIINTIPNKFYVSGFGFDVAIPVIGVTQEVGNILLQAIENGPVNVSLSRPDSGFLFNDSDFDNLVIIISSVNE